MAIDLNDDILQDFLVEAGEILELLGEQLVELEHNPDDQDLLNAVFRGFHTVKGGAGFLALEPLVAVCHRAEDVFNLLRQGDLHVDAQLMDVILQVTDVVNEMMDNIRNGIDPDEADPNLLSALESLKNPQAATTSAPEQELPESAPVVDASPEAGSADELFDSMLDSGAEAAAPASDEITEDEFESLLDELQGKAKTAAEAAVPEAVSSTVGSASASSGGSDDEITEEEFEALLDQLHGDKAPKAVVPLDTTAIASAAAASDEITDDEFESLLDDLHGKAKGPTSKSSAPAPTVETDEAPAKPAPVTASAAPATTTSTAVPPPAKTATAKPVKKANPKAGKEATPAAETTVRVDTSRLDDIMNLVGELVLVRNRMATLKSSMENEEVAKAIANLDLVTADLQSSVMKTRMQPIKKVFGRFPRVVRDLSRSLNKEVNLELHGEDTDLDKNLVEALADPLVHLVRNAVDHGVETPDEREKAGKPRAGTVVLSARQEGDHILLKIEDDGKGMNPDVLRQKAVEKGLMDEEAASRLDDRACYNLIFAPGFSTKTEISDVSGRGVGMDVVKTRIAQLNGAVEIDSEEGRGSSIVIKLPLTLAIMPTLMVVLGEQVFALPLANVNEIFDLESAQISTVDGKQVVIVREKAVPLVHLGNWLVNDANYEGSLTDGYVVVATVGNQHIGCVVDNLVGQEEVVIKPLGALLHGTKGVSGATITGNGGIALILDMPGLMETYASRV